MKRFSKARLGFFAASIALMACQASQALAQLPADAERAATSSASPARVDEQLMDQGLVPSVSPQVEVRNLVLQQPPAGAENIHLTLNTLQLEGVTAYNENQLAPVYADKIGQSISLADVYGIASALTTKYRNDGYILTQVVVPPQTIEGGHVKLQVVEGYVDKINVEGADQETALQLIRQYASHIRTGRALNTSDLERWLLLINDLPGVEARSILSPSATQPGAADLRVITTRDSFDGLLAVDDYGSRYLGPIQTTAAGALNSRWGNNELVSGQVVLAPDPNMGAELAYLSFGYQQPIGRYGTKILLNGSHTSTEPGFDLDQFNVKGRSQLFSVKLRHPFIRSRTENLYAHVMFDWRDVESKNILEPTRRDRIRAIRAGGRYEFLDTMMGVGINSVDLELAQGLNILGSSDEDDLRLTRPAGDPNFTKLNAELQRLQRVTSKVNLLVGLRGQWASDALLSSEEFGVGGINIGRGFDPSEVVGDHGVAGKVEVQWNKPYQWNFVQDYQVFGFYDAGHVWNEDATTSSLKTDTITSAGFGVRMDFKEQTEFDLGVAFPLNRDVQTQGDRDPKAYLNLSRRF